MMTLITGVPGAGKTLRAVQLIRAAVNEGRPVYSDIDGLALDGVEPAPDDWRDTPEGSLVVYDECQHRWPSTGKPGAHPSEVVAAIDTHQHTGHDLMFVTQAPRKVHHSIRQLVGQHFHHNRVGGFQGAQVFE